VESGEQTGQAQSRVNVQKQDHPSIKIICVGVSGVGKNTLWEKLVRREKGVRWYFLYDHKDRDFQRRFGVKPCYTEDDLIAAIVRGGFVVFNPAKMFPGKKEKGWAWFCWWLWKIKGELRGRKIIGCDELEAVCPERARPHSFLRILDEGRTYQFDGFFIAQSMNGMHNQVRKQITEIFAFRQGDKNGCDWLDEKFPRETRIEWEKLPNGIWHYKNTTTGKIATGGKAFKPKGAERDLSGL
jgi:hypothetical protein